ncbi:hypothetical protein NDU88_011342 [Pleurodeles waltl]|uniref:Uncharacterized protein n=1 Tax=Pleurodeles waltl TaxID=8319 RepID=A0AAV7S0U5_PLEWA|nr:hypothetical protein NDU88_011342 [Pleurodeles waltl]
MVTANREGQQVTQNVSWFRKVEPRVGNSGPGFEEENGEEFEGSCPSLPSSPNECRRGGGGVFCRGSERSSSPDWGPVKGPEPTGRSERYNLRPNPNPSQRLRDFIC